MLRDRNTAESWSDSAAHILIGADHFYKRHDTMQEIIGDVWIEMISVDALWCAPTDSIYGETGEDVLL